MEKITSVTTIRKIDPDDYSFVFSSWLRSYRQAFPVRNMPSQLYYDKQKQIIEYILSRADIHIACNVEDHGQIFGWVCFESRPIHTIHFVYTKQPYRQMGIANALLITAFDCKPHEASVTQATHETKFYRYLMGNFQMILNPYYLWEIYANAKLNEN